MSTWLKVLVSLASIAACSVVGGCIGVWRPVRNVPIGQTTPGDNLGELLFGGMGLISGAVVGLAGAKTLFKSSRLTVAVWSLINLCLLVGVPVWAYFDLLREVDEGHRSGTITNDEDSIAIPLMGIIMGVVIVAVVFNVLWGCTYLLLRRRRQSKRDA